MAEYRIEVTVDGAMLYALLAVLDGARGLNDEGEWRGVRAGVPLRRDDLWPANALVTRVREAFIDAVGGDGFERDAMGVYRVTNPTVGRGRPMLRTLV